MVRHTCTQKERLKEITERQNRFDGKLDRIFDKLDTIENNTATLPQIKDDVKQNTEFRIKSTGIIGFVAFICTTLGGGIVWLFMRITR